jgi:hypothetical protein
VQGERDLWAAVLRARDEIVRKRSRPSLDGRLCRVTPQIESACICVDLRF